MRVVAGQGIQRLGATEAGGRAAQQMEKEVAIVDLVVLCLHVEKEKGEVGEGDLDHKFHIQQLKIQMAFFQ